MRTALQGAALGLLFFVLGGCGDSGEAVTLTGDTMGTSYHITVVPPPGFDTAQAKSKIDALLAVYSRITSTYIEDSEVNRFSRLPLEQWHTVSQTLSEILLIGMEVNWITGGAFDVTIAPLVELWGFGATERDQAVPPKAAIETAKINVGYQHLQLDLQEPKVLKKRAVELDLSGIAKGYGVDMLAQWLERQGVTDYLVEIGGEIRAAGKSPRGDVWRIGIERPEMMGGVERAIRVSGVGLATSGDYRNYFEEDGVRYSHTLDPKSGYPIRHRLASVTVVAETAAYADALATGFLVLGPEKTRKLAEEHGIAVYLIEKTDEGFAASHSSAFAPYLE